MKSILTTVIFIVIFSTFSCKPPVTITKTPDPSAAARDSSSEVVVLGYSAKPEDTEDQQETVFSKALSGRAPGISTSRRRRSVSPVPQAEREDYNREGYDRIDENRFHATSTDPLSTFSIDVDRAAYSNLRRLIQQGRLPAKGTVRTEELINYFHYDYPQPKSGDPFSINTEISTCPWSPRHQLVMIGLQGKRIPVEHLPASNLVFLIDVSGSMMDDNKLPLVQSSLKLLTAQLREQDKVSIVVYAGNAGLVLPATSGSRKETIADAISSLEAGGSTAGGAGIMLAYAEAARNFIPGGNNRVILCTDGDFNVGTSSDADLENLIEEKRKSGVFLTVLGYGMGNYQDSKMQKLADKGNGNHAYIDNVNEAAKVLVNEFGGTLFTIAKDVKLQVEFNPAKVQAYRLVGYENRVLNKEDFNNDKRDAGEIGSGHTVTALYELIPAGVRDPFVESVDPLRYPHTVENGDPRSGELMTVKFRYKKPGEDNSQLITHHVPDEKKSPAGTSENFRFVAAVAEFGMLLNDSEFKQLAGLSHLRALASSALGTDKEGYRSEFVTLVDKAKLLMPGEHLSQK